MEFMSQYDCKIVYIKGEENCVADTLSHMSFEAEEIVSSPYPPDNNDLVAVVLGTDHSSFICAHVMTKPGTIPVSTLILTMSVDEELLETICSGYVEDHWYAQLLDVAFLPHRV